MRKILSIDGGGIRGIVPAIWLASMEQRTGKRVCELFDLIAGTSTGGILALGLTRPDPAGKAAFGAAELAELYQEHGGTIFQRPRWRRMLPVGNILDEKYGSAGIEQVLETYFGDSRLKDATANVLVTSYEIERRFPFFFRSERAKADPYYDFAMKSAARATSAAPTYFSPVKLEATGSAGYWALVDGGVFANNPSLCALMEAQRLFGEEEFLLVSLGTGSLTRPIRYEKARHWGVARWAKPVLDIAFDGVSSTVDYQLRQLLPRNGQGRRRYFRMQTVLDASQESMDKATPDNLRGLRLLAECYLRDRAEEMDEICSAVS